MTALAVSLIAAGLIGTVAGIVWTVRRPKPVAEEDWIAPHAVWLDEHEVDRRFNAIVDAERRAEAA